MGLCFSKKDVLGRRPLSLREQMLSDLAHDRMIIMGGAGGGSPTNSTATTMTTATSSIGGGRGVNASATERWRRAVAEDDARANATATATAATTGRRGSSSSPLIQAIDATYGMDNIAKSYAHFHRRRRLLEIGEDVEIDGEQQDIGLAKKTMRRSLHVFGDDSEDEQRCKSRLGGSGGTARGAGGSRRRSGFESMEEEDDEEGCAAYVPPVYGCGYGRVYGSERPSFLHGSYFAGRCSFSTDEVSTTSTTYATDSGDEAASRRSSFPAPPSSTAAFFGRSSTSWSSPPLSYEKRIFEDEPDGDDSDDSDDLFEIANLEAAAVLSSLSSSEEQEFRYSGSTAAFLKDPGISCSTKPTLSARTPPPTPKDLPAGKASAPASGRKHR